MNITTILSKIILTIIPMIITSSLGYISVKLKFYSEKIKNKENNEELQNVAIKIILKSQLTKTFFVYNELQKIPDYVYQDFQDVLKVYEYFGGDGYVHALARKMENWKIVKTDILK